MSDSSVGHRCVNETENTKKTYPKNAAPKLMKGISKICLPRTKFRKSRMKKSGLHDHPKRTSMLYFLIELIIILGHDSNINLETIDNQTVPKIKLEEVSKAKKLSKLRSSYQSELYTKDDKYGENQKNVKTKINMLFDNAQNAIPARRSMKAGKYSN